MSSDDRKPNIVVVTVDALRADHLGFVKSSHEVTTPRIDEFASNAVRCETAYANAPHTRASFPAILTGTYPWMYGGYESIAPERPVMAEEFSEAGYETAGFHSNPYLSAEFNYDRGFRTFESGDRSPSLLARCRTYVMEQFFGDRKDTLAYKIIEKVYSHASYAVGRDLGLPYLTGQELNEMALDWIDDTAEPLFLWVHYMDVHDPYVPHQGTVSEGLSHRRAIKLQKKMVDEPDSVTPDERDVLNRLYRGEVEYLDRCLDTLLAAIDDRLGPSLVAFLADHGEAFDEHGYFRHPHEFHEEVVRIPFLLRGPEREHSVVRTPVSTVDLMPSVLRYAGLQVPGVCVGEPVWKFETADSPGRVLFGETGSRDTGKTMAVDAEWKLIRELETGEETLYNVTEDPDERVDRSGDAISAGTRLREALDGHLAAVEATSEGTQQTHEIPGDIENRLEKLGYK